MHKQKWPAQAGLLLNKNKSYLKERKHDMISIKAGQRCKKSHPDIMTGLPGQVKTGRLKLIQTRKEQL